VKAAGPRARLDQDAPDHPLGRDQIGKVASRVVQRQQLQPAGDSARPQALPTEFLVEVIGAGGQISMAGGPLGAADGPRLSAAQLSDTGTPFSANAAGGPGSSWRVLVQPLSGGRHVVIAYSLDDLNSTVTRLEIADAVAGAVCVVLLAGIGLPLVRASLAPLARIEVTATAIASGDLSRRIDQPAGNTEVGRLAEALDVMLASIETAYLARADGEARALGSEERMRRFVADASHELRTPLTSVRGLAEHGLQQDTAATREELLRLMALIVREADRMGRMVADLLLLARHDAGRPLDRRPVDLASLAAEAVIRARIVDPGRPITLEAVEPVIVDGRGQLTVADQGPGMTAEQASRVFERFYRTDGARTRARGGTGLGLAIAASLTAAHGGEITIDTAPGCGAAFHVRLPLAGT
jgi:two-component system, OmpR family, sensor kinase